jgi:hypothetical protein
VRAATTYHCRNGVLTTSSNRHSRHRDCIDDATNGNGTCANIKAAGVMICTIPVNTGGDPTAALLENCARIYHGRNGVLTTSTKN